MVEMHTQPFEWFWREVYSYHFPCFVDCSPAVGLANPTYARTGIDRIVYCGNGANFKIKEVNVNYACYPNIPICLSTDTQKAELGWMYADYPIDKIAYGYCDPSGNMNKSGAYLFDYPAFQRAYFSNQHEWRRKFQPVFNEWPDYDGHRTRHEWMLVPLKDVLRALTKAQIVKCTSFESMKRELLESPVPITEPIPLRITEAA